MTIEAVVQFLEASSTDESLRADLAGIIGVGDGDIGSAQELDQEEAQALLGKRSILVSAFASQRGYSFTVAELGAVVGVFQQYQAGEISETDFSQALGLSETSGQVSPPLDSVSKTVELVYRGAKFSKPQGQDSPHQVLDFMKKTGQDAEFREQLQQILVVGDGDISNFSELDAEEAQALTSAQGALVAEFAAQNGFVFTFSDLMAVTDAFQRVQSGDLSDEEFNKFLSVSVSSRDHFPIIQNVVSMAYRGIDYTAPIISKSRDNTLPVIRFMECSASDPSLRDQLMKLLGGDGNISKPSELDAQEAAVLSGDNSKQVIALGAERGFRFTVADLSAVVGAFGLVKSGELAEENCARILGLGRSSSAIESVKKTAGLVYRGVSQ